MTWKKVTCTSRCEHGDRQEEDVTAFLVSPGYSKLACYPTLALWLGDDIKLPNVLGKR